MLAGGQSLVPLMKLRFASPELLVDINNLPGLGHHESTPTAPSGSARFAGTPTSSAPGAAPASQPTMAAAAPLIADPIVRNRGTLVGSLCHADPQGDWAAVVTALGGHVVAQGAGGRRTINDQRLRHRPVHERPRLRRDRGRGGDPGAQGTAAGGYLKLERRVGDFATVGVAVAVDLVGGRVARAGIGLTGVGSSTIDAREAADSLVGQALDDGASSAPRTSLRPPRSRRPTTGAAPSTSGTSSTPS